MHINQNEKREQDHVLDNLSQRIYADRQTQDANASVEQKAALINDQARRHPYRLATPTTPPRIGEKKKPPEAWEEKSRSRLIWPLRIMLIR